MISAYSMRIHPRLLISKVLNLRHGSYFTCHFQVRTCRARLQGFQAPCPSMSILISAETRPKKGMRGSGVMTQSCLVDITSGRSLPAQTSTIDRPDRVQNQTYMSEPDIVPRTGAHEGHGENEGNPKPQQHANQSVSSAVITHSSFGDHTRIHQGNLYMTIQGAQRES